MVEAETNVAPASFERSGFQALSQTPASSAASQTPALFALIVATRPPLFASM